MSNYEENYDANEQEGLFEITPEQYADNDIPEAGNDVTPVKHVEYKIYDYAQSEIERLRAKRQSDLIPTSEEVKQEKFLTPLYVITAVFAALMIIGPFLVKQGPNRGIIQASILLTAFCMWIFLPKCFKVFHLCNYGGRKNRWFTIYFGQMNPLMGPRLENTTVAWMAYKLGKPFNSSS